MTADNSADEDLREWGIQRPNLRVRNKVGGGAVEICQIAIDVRRGRIRDEAGLVTEFGRALPKRAHAGPDGRSDHWNQQQPDRNGQLALKGKGPERPHSPVPLSADQRIRHTRVRKNGRPQLTAIGKAAWRPTGTRIV